jgi:hypothetical protein
MKGRRTVSTKPAFSRSMTTALKPKDASGAMSSKQIKKE